MSWCVVWRAGKSTLLRQVCLAALMAQVGAWVPAESLEMTPVDAIFVRMGARDAIMSGQVTLTDTISPSSSDACFNFLLPINLLQTYVKRFITF